MAEIWRLLTTDDVLARLPAPEFDAVEANALAEGQDSPWESLLEAVAETIRGAVPTGMTLGPEGMVFPGAVRYAISLVIVDGLGRFGLENLITEFRTQQADAAAKWLKDLRAGNVRVPVPETAAAAAEQGLESQMVAGEQVNARDMTRARLRKLF